MRNLKCENILRYSNPINVSRKYCQAISSDRGSSVGTSKTHLKTKLHIKVGHEKNDHSTNPLSMYSNTIYK